MDWWGLLCLGWFGTIARSLRLGLLVATTIVTIAARRQCSAKKTGDAKAATVLAPHATNFTITQTGDIEREAAFL